MAGQFILIIDDTPVTLKLASTLLTNEGFTVRTVPDAEQALEMLNSMRPALILVDIQLPGMDGLEFARRVKADPNTRDIIVVALTAFAMRDNEERALAAGCDGYITKPVDSRTLAARVRACLAMRVPAENDTQPALKAAGLSGSELEALRCDFLTQALLQSREMLKTLGPGFDADEACRLMHQWIGSAGSLQYGEVSSIARELEQVLQQRPLELEHVRKLLGRMVRALPAPAGEAGGVDSAAIAASLGERTIALVGFAPLDVERIGRELTRFHAFARPYGLGEPFDPEGIQGCDLLMIQVGAQTPSNSWLDEAAPAVSGKPAMFVGDREALARLRATVREAPAEFLEEPWEPAEVLGMAARALSHVRRTTPEPPRFPAAAKRPDVVVADDDPTVLSIVRSTLRNHGMDVRTATNGTEALQQLRLQVPDAAILDINMPGLDGFELLTQIRRDKLAVNVILLTARQQHNDLWQGFNLGAHDYVVKPFSPMELVARVKRLLPTN